MNEQLENSIINYLSENISEIHAIYLFGSITGNDFGKESDIDIAVLIPVEMDHSRLFSLQGELEVILNKDVDLIDLSASSEVFQAQIIGDGKRIFTHQDKFSEVEEFENRVFQAFIYLKENIRPILEEIKRSGQIYRN